MCGLDAYLKQLVETVLGLAAVVAPLRLALTRLHLRQIMLDQ